MHARLLFLLALAASAMLAAQSAEYLIGPQDVLAITVLGEQEMSGRYRVDADGTITFPLIGKLAASGRSVLAIEADLQQRLASGFFKNPQVSVAVETYRSQRIFVVGEVDRPGPYPLSGEITLLEALSMAGSPGAASGDEIIIVRPNQGVATVGPLLPQQTDVSTVIRVDLRELQSGALFQGTTLRDGDTIFVPKAESIFIFGQVRNPGSFPVKRGTTVLQALALAGGLTDRGSTSRVRIIRILQGKKTEINVRASDTVEPGDTVIVRERLF